MASYIQHLDDLRDKYQDGIVSLLIGTGFSQNAYHDMPLWDGLLLDMAKEQYDDNLSESELKTIIKKDPTAIVETYLKSHNRSQLDSYIEERIPFIDQDLKIWFSPKTGYDPILKGSLNDDDLYLHYQLLNGNWLNIYTTNYDNLLELASVRRGKDYKVITHRNDIPGSIRNRNIIKLHGSIIDPRTDAISPSFDRQDDIRYVISETDYEQYASKHDAFCNVIKVSLLQGFFCLIGFSGTDPNFLKWVEWLKNIIDATLLNQAKEKICPSVYIIDLSKEEFPHAYLKDLRDHYIHVIRLFDPKVKEAIEVDANEGDYKVLLTQFLSYLYKNEKSTAQYLKNQEYQELWSKSLTWFQPKATVNYDVLPSILKLKKSHRIIKEVFWQEELLDRIYTKEPFSGNDVDYILCALQDTMFVPGQYQGLDGRLQKTNLSQEQNALYLQMHNREVTLFRPKESFSSDSDAAIYESILRHIFLLEFDQAALLLEEWNPSGLFIIKKAFFSRLLNLPVNIEKVRSLTASLDNKEALWATNLLNAIDYDHPFKYDTTKYDSQGLSNLYDISDVIMKACMDKKIEIEPYGSTKDKVIWIGKSDTDYRKSFRFLQFLIEMPHAPQFGIISYFEAGKWYSVFKPLFEKVPYPAVFYSLFYRDKKVLKRIGQDIAYSQRLYDNGFTEDILVRMLKALLQEKHNSQFVEGIFYVGAQLFISVRPEKWQNLFYEFWQRYVSKDFTVLEKPSGISDFVHQAISHLSDKSIVCGILRNCLLRTTEPKEINFAIDMLYYLRKMQIDSAEIEQDVNNFIDRIHDVKEFVVITNVHYYLSENQAKRIAEKILPMIIGKQLPTIVIRPLCYYAKFNPQILEEVKQCILTNQHLWDNGLRGEYSVSSETIKLTHFKNIIEWSQPELTLIYNSLKESFYQLISHKSYQDKGSFYILSNYDDLFDEMYDFLDSNKKQLSTINDFSKTKRDVKRELNTTRGFEDIETALCSDDKTTFKWGLRELLKAYRMGKIRNGEIFLLVLLDRILMQNQVSLRSSFDFASYILKNYYNSYSLSKSVLIKRKFFQILALYNEELLQEINQEIPIVGSYLADIATTLDKMGYKSKAITRWKTFLSNDRYFIIPDEE